MTRRIILSRETNFSYNFSGEVFLNSSELLEGDVCFPFNVYLDFLHSYYTPFIVIVGLIGNFLAALVFLNTHLKFRSSSYYLAALAIADFGFLFVVFVVYCSYNDFFELYNRNGWCQVFVYTSSVCASMSVWLIVAFTVERFIAVQYPLQRPYICTVSRAKIVVFSLLTFALTTQSFIFWIAGLIRVDDRQECEMLPDYEAFAKIVNFIDTFITLIIPVLLIVTMNLMIANNLLHFKRRLQSRSLDEYIVSNNESAFSGKTELQQANSLQSNISNRHMAGDLPSQNSHHKSSFIRKYPKKITEGNRQHHHGPIEIRKTRNHTTINSQENINKMLLIISSVFITLNFPSYLIRLYIFFVFTLRRKVAPNYLWCAQQFAMLLYYTNFGINFMLYAMYGETFRRCLIQLLRNFFKRISSSYSYCELIVTGKVKPQLLFCPYSSLEECFPKINLPQKTKTSG